MRRRWCSGGQGGEVAGGLVEVSDVVRPWGAPAACSSGTARAHGFEIAAGVAPWLRQRNRSKSASIEAASVDGSDKHRRLPPVPRPSHGPPRGINDLAVADDVSLHVRILDDPLRAYSSWPVAKHGDIAAAERCHVGANLHVPMSAQPNGADRREVLSSRISGRRRHGRLLPSSSMSSALAQDRPHPKQVVDLSERAGLRRDTSCGHDHLRRAPRRRAD